MVSQNSEVPSSHEHMLESCQLSDKKGLEDFLKVSRDGLVRILSNRKLHNLGP